jgi:hypothetical protein
MSYPQYFNFRGHRYYKSLVGMGSRKGALIKCAEHREDNPKIRWAIHREDDGRYSVGHSE